MRPPCEECRSVYGDDAACDECPLCVQIDVLSQEAWRAFTILHTHSRVIDSMSGMLIPLRIRDIREEAERTSDSEEAAIRIMAIDEVFISAWTKLKKNQTKASK